MFKNKNRKPSNLARPDRTSPGGLSSRAEPTRKHRPDYLLLILCLALLGTGLIVVYSISPGLAATVGVSDNYFVSKQLIAIGLGLVAFAIFSSLSLSVIKNMRNALLTITAIAAIGVQLFGEEVNGASRWIQAGGLSFQVAELIKFTLIVCLASFLVDRVNEGKMTSTKETLRPLLIIMAIIGVVVAKFESDLGSAAVMIAIILIMAFVAGLPVQKIAMISAIVLIGIILAIASSSYRRERVATFLNPSSDCQSSGYQACQALIAVGSGGMFGLGLGKSVQAYGYLPEAANDSIFAVLAEKFGFIGVSVVISIYLWLFSRFRKIVLHTPDLYSRLFVIGVFAWISVQTMINMGAMIGLLPLKGITLPFISYGGTSLVFVMAALGVVFQISRYTSFAPIRNVTTGEGTSEYLPRGGRQRRPHYAPYSSR